MTPEPVADDRARVIADVLAALDDPRWRDDVDADWLESAIRAALSDTADPDAVKWCGFCDAAGHTTDECTIREVHAAPDRDPTASPEDQT